MLVLIAEQHDNIDLVEIITNLLGPLRKNFGFDTLALEGCYFPKENIGKNTNHLFISATKKALAREESDFEHKLHMSINEFKQGKPPTIPQQMTSEMRIQYEALFTVPSKKYRFEQYCQANGQGLDLVGIDAPVTNTINSITTSILTQQSLGERDKAMADYLINMLQNMRRHIIFSVGALHCPGILSYLLQHKNKEFPNGFNNVVVIDSISLSEIAESTVHLGDSKYAAAAAEKNKNAIKYYSNRISIKEIISSKVKADPDAFFNAIATSLKKINPLAPYDLNNFSEENLQQALRQAAADNRIIDIPYLLRNVKNINAQGPTYGKTQGHLIKISPLALRQETCNPTLPVFS
jgi:hypothetical protein